MALHRDIFWIGRQWAVTGLGMQAINQKHGGQFDIAIERLWDDDLADGLRDQKWFNPDDFAKGLAIAQARHSKPPARPAPPPLPVQTLLKSTIASAQAVLPEAAAAQTADPDPPRPPQATPSLLQMGSTGHSAKLLRVWRVRRRQ
jgi:hypothetical protein